MEGSKRDKGKILIAGGREKDTEALSAVLAGQGYSVQATPSGQSTLIAVEAFSPDLILLGSHLPDVSSDELCRQLGSGDGAGDRPILWIDDGSAPQDLPTLLSAGAADCVVSPYRPEEVQARIETHLQVRKLRTQLAELDGQLAEEVALREEAVQVLQEGEQTGYALLESLNDVIYTADGDGTLTYVSPAIERLLGYPPAEVVGHSLREFIHPDDLARLATNLATIFAGRTAANEYRVLTRSGEVRWMRTSSQPVVRGDQVMGVQGVLSDITERKLAEEQIRQQNEFLTNVLESLTHPFYVVNADDYTIEIANSAARLEATSGQATCYALTHRRSEPCSTDEHPCPVEDVKRTRRSMTVEHLHYDLAGNPRQVEVRAYPLFDIEGKVTRVIEYTLDVTERKQAEEALRESERRYRQLLETLQEGIWVIDQDGVTTFVNPRMAEMLGYTVEEMQGRHLFSFMDQRGVEIAQRNLERRAQGIREQHDFEFLRKDGSRLYALLETSPITDDDGNYVGAIAGIQDITERLRAEEALRKADAILRETQHMARVGGWELDLETGQVIWTEEVYRIHELPFEFEPTLQSALDFYDPDDQLRLTEAIQQCTETGRPWDLELRFNTATGKRLWVRTLGKAEFMNGRAVRLSGTFQDITERKQAEEALRESEARWRSVTENSPDHVILLDTDLNIQFVNYPSPGLSVSQLIGTPLYAYVQEERQSEIKRILGHVLETGEPTSYETEFVTPEAETIYYESRVVPRLLDGEVVGLAVNARDVTAYKRGEQALRKAIAAAEQARYEEGARRQEADQRRRVAESLVGVLAALNSNQPLDRILNYIAAQARERLDNQAVSIYRPDESTGRLTLQAAQGMPHSDSGSLDTASHLDALGQAMALHQPVTIPDVESVHPGSEGPAGHVDPLLPSTSQAVPCQALLAVPIVVKDQIYGGILMCYNEPREFSDEEVELATAFSDQVALAIENARLREQVEQAATAAERSRLARDLHDSVTQALFSASLVAEILPQVWQRDPAAAQQGLEELRLLTRSALAEMRTLLLELRPTALLEARLNDLLSQLTEAVSSRVQLEFLWDIEPVPDLPSEVHVTFYRIAQEALHNIVKHAQASQVTVDLHASPPFPGEGCEDWQGQVTLQISDDGQGFDPGGLGPDQLGLGIMRERAETIGAKLTIASQPGQGTQVTLVWPQA